MSNIHTPERLDGETQAAYRQRRARSKELTRRATLSGYHKPPGRSAPSTRDYRKRPGLLPMGLQLAYVARVFGKEAMRAYERLHRVA